MAVYPERRKGRLTGKWIAEVPLHGKRQRGRFDTKKEADQWEGVVKLTGELPIAPQAEVPTGPSYGEVAQEVRANNRAWLRGKDKTSLDRHEYVVEFIGPDKPITSVTTSDLDKLVKHLKGRPVRGGGIVKSSTINRYLSAASKVLRYALDRKHIEYVPKVPWLKEDGNRLHWLEAEQEATVCRILEEQGKPEYAVIVRVLTATGMRWGELAGLEPSQIEPNWLRLWETKNGQARSVPIGEDLSAKLRALVANGMLPKYFPFWKAFKRALKSAGLPSELCIHSLRHTTGTRLVQKNVNLRIVQKYLGHKNINTTLRYTHVADTDLQSAYEKITPSVGES
jgi:integrase